MVKGVINLQKESGGITKISPVDGIGVTEVTVPESGELVTKWYVDNRSPIVKPTIVSPANGTTDYTGAVTATYTKSETYLGAQDYVEWQASTTNTFGTLLDSYSGNSNLLSWTPAVGGLDLVPVYVRTRQGSDNHLSDWSEPISFVTPNIGIGTPTLTVEGAPSSIGEKPVLTSSAFSVFNGTDTHKSTDWIIEQSGTVVWSSIGDTTNKLSITVPAWYLVESTQYTFKVKHNGNTYGSSSYATVTGTTKSQFFDYDSDFGKELEGGYYAGKIQRADGVYALIVAPKALGQSSKQWKNDNTTSGGCKSLNNGAINTAHMVASGNATVYPAAHYCNDLVINGYSDWYLPARDELEIAYRNLKPTTNANVPRTRLKSSYVYTDINDGATNTMGMNSHSIPAGVAYTTSNPSQTTLAPFKQGGAETFYVNTDSRYWSSTEAASDLVWDQLFSGSYSGDQYGGGITFIQPVRAFRAVKIS